MKTRNPRGKKRKLLHIRRDYLTGREMRTTIRNINSMRDNLTSKEMRTTKLSTQVG